MERRDRPRADGGDGKRRALLLMKAQDVLDPAEVSDDTDAGPTVFTEGFDDAVIAAAVRLVRLKRSHRLRIYTGTTALVNC